MSYKEKKIININSNDATQKINGSFLSELSFSFPNIVSQNEDIEYLEGGLESAVFPVSFYVVNYSNNIFSYSIFHLEVITDYSITIPVGNYDYKTLFEAMHTAFTANGHNFVLTLNEVDGKMTMEYKPTSGRVFYRINHSLSTSFRILGFDVDTDYFPTSDILVAPFPLNLLGIKKIKIFCPQFSNNNLDSTRYATTSLLTTIINDQAPFGQINYYNNTGEYSGRLKVFEMNVIDIRVTDEFGASINFNNCDWSMTFVLNIYKQNSNRSVKKIIMSKEESKDEKKTKNSDKPTETEIEPEPNIEEPMSDNIKDLNFLLGINPNYLD
jgi:hypothetical protein